MTPPVPHVLHVFATFAAGGPQVRTTRLMDALGRDYRHSVLAMDGVTTAAAILPDAIDVDVLPSFPRAGGWTTARRVRALVRELRPDLVCTYNWGSIEAVWGALAAGARVVHHEDGFLPDELAGFKRRRVWTRRWTLPRVSGVVVPSHTLANIAREHWCLPQDKLHLIPNGLRLEAFPLADGNPDLRAELGLTPDTFVVGAVGHLRPEKNPARLVRAVARMETPAHLVLVGDGPERDAVLAAAREGGIVDRLHLAGHRTETQPWYALMDAFGISSDTEQMPVALLEAMASGLPVASTDVGDVAAMLGDEAARVGVVPLTGETDAALAQALDRLGKDRTAALALGRAGRDRVERDYTFERMVAAYRERYD